ncbi:nitrate/nitrite two-component system sensor histidine kinase NarQ [Parasalinivibrio latis]
MVLILLLSVVITSFSLLTLASSLNDAAAVNTSGSLRMQSYRLAYDIVRDSALYEQHVGKFEESLLSPELTLLNNWAVPEEIIIHYEDLIGKWVRLKPELLGNDREFYLEQVALFVNDIDRFVFELQKFSEDKLQTLAIVSSAGLGLILCISLFLIHFTQRKIVNPLHALVLASQQIQSKNFNISVPPVTQNELGVLAYSFRSMATDLKTLYDDQEQMIEEKTRSLTQANKSLGVLYDCSTQLSNSQLGRDNFEEMLKTLLAVDGIKAARLVVEEEGQPDWFIQVGNINDSHWHRHALSLDGEALGHLECQYSLPCPDQQLINNVARIMSRGVYYNRTQKQTMQLMVMEERATIARELHDSLAQTLSYLKIQTTLLKRQIAKLDNDNLTEITNEIDGQLKDAYTQLRELLTTFRLSIDSANFNDALDQMLATLREQTDATIEVDNHLPSVVVQAQHQVHLMQIIREAVLNAIKHAQAETISVSCNQSSGQVGIAVTDNGVGFDVNSEKRNHYGMAIMYERTKRLGGNLTVSSKQGHGSRIALSFRLAD